LNLFLFWGKEGGVFWGRFRGLVLPITYFNNDSMGFNATMLFKNGKKK
jgi:hypothetical protein